METGHVEGRLQCSRIIGSNYKGVQIAWRKAFVMLVLHLLTAYAFFMLGTNKAKIETFVFSYAYASVGFLGVSAGVHRLWSHRSYKARLPLRIFLMLTNCIALQDNIFKWSHDHRIHHKYTDTDADPYNAKRGFFFSHIGWILFHRHPEVIAKGKSIDCSDILSDPVVRFQVRYYWFLTFVLSFLIPAGIVRYLFDEPWWAGFLVAGVWKHTVSLHVTWLINSAAHMWGNRPYDRHITPRDNILLSILTLGESFHNYHHAFPSDYSTSEFGIRLNFTTFFINLMALVGLAHDLKTATPDMINKRKSRTGE